MRAVVSLLLLPAPEHWSSVIAAAALPPDDLAMTVQRRKPAHSEVEQLTRLPKEIVIVAASRADEFAIGTQRNWI